MDEGDVCKFWGYSKTAAGETGVSCGDFANNTCGPELWYSFENTSCAAYDQSPITVISRNATASPGSRGATDLSFKSPATSNVGEFVVSSTGVAVNIPAIYQSGFNATWEHPFGTLNTYYLQGYDFHAPSEHAIDGMYFDMEAHLNYKHNVTGAVLVIAVFLKTDTTLKAKCTAINNNHVHCQRALFLENVLLGNMTEAALRKVVAGLISPATYTHTSTNVSVDPHKGFVPPMGTYFYWYNGSLTAPPCTGGVTWVLHPVPVLMFDTTVRLFTGILGDYQNNGLNMSSNSRPVQLTGSRKVYVVGKTGYTTLTAPAYAGQISLPVADHAGFAVGDKIIIEPSTSRQEAAVVSGYGSLVISTPLHYNHPAGASVFSVTTTTPGVTVTPASGAATTTPSVTITPISPIMRYSDSNHKYAKESESASNMVFVGVGCVIGMLAVMIVQGARNRMRYARVQAIVRDADEGENRLLSSVE